MFRDIRRGHFQPDQSRSGMFRREEHEVNPAPAQDPGLVTDVPLPAPEEGVLSWIHSLRAGNLETPGIPAVPAAMEPSEGSGYNLLQLR